MRILIGYQDTELAHFDAARYDVRFVTKGRDGHSPPTSISEMLEACPPGWKPDVYLHSSLIHYPVPADIETFDGMTVTIVGDWHRGGRSLWTGAGFFDHVLSDRNACLLLKSSGYENAHVVRLMGSNPALHRVLPDVERDIDVLFVGSLNADIWEERNRWLERVARLSSQHRVVIASGHYGEHFVRLLNRAKIVFNRSVNGAINQRIYEATACGALVFNEDENEETKEVLTEGVHGVYYNDENFEDRIAWYLAHEEERLRIAEAGRQIVLAEHTEAAHTNALFARLEALQGTPHYRPYAHLPVVERNYRKCMQFYSSTLPAATQTALPLLAEAEQAGMERARGLEARAAMHGWIGHYLKDENKIKFFTQALEFARQAAKVDSSFPHAQMTLGFLLLERAEATQGRHPTGRNDIAEAALALSNTAELCEAGQESEGTGSSLKGFGYPRWSDNFDCCVERAYLLHDVDEAAWALELRAILAWRCRSMLSDLAFANEQREEAYRQAVGAWQNLPQNGEACLRLARCEVATGRLAEAVEHYRAGLAITPFAFPAWPELATLLTALGRQEEAAAFVQDRLQILVAMPAYAAMRPALLSAIGAQARE